MKNKIKNQKFSGFFLNMLGVILGIVLTFGVNALWQKHEDKKKVNEIMTLLRHELEVNKEWFKTQRMLIKSDTAVYRKILAANGDWESIHPDTLKQYRNQVSQIWYVPFTTSAWQIFQNSEVIQKMNNQKLVIAMLNGYTEMTLFKELIMDEYWNEKKKAIVTEEDPYKYFDEVMNSKESVAFYKDFALEASLFWELFTFADNGFDYLLPILDKDGYYLYNPEP